MLLLLALYSTTYCRCVTFSLLFLVFMMNFNPDFESADFEEHPLLPIITAIVEEEESQSKQACQIDEPEKLYIKKLLNCGHKVWIYEILRMHLATFYTI